jgi:recombination protein RecA
MTTPRGDVDAAVAGLRARWGAAAPRVIGALALAPAPAEPEDDEVAATTAPARPQPAISPLPGERIIHTGFAALDAILGPGGLPTSASVAIRGDGSSGRTTLALRVAAEAQAQGSVVAWLDLSRSFDPVEAVSRGIRLEWLVVITPADLDEGLRIAGSLLAGRSVDLLVLDLPGGRLARTDTPAKVADRLHRMAALARRAETLLLILDAPGLGGGLSTAVDQSTGIRLELARRSWVRLGRDIIGQRTEALVAHDRYGRPGRTATLRILYAEGGERDACLARDALLIDALDAAHAPQATPERPAPPGHAPPVHAPAPEAPDRETHDHATTPRLRAAPVPGPGTGPTLRALPAGAARPGRQAMGPGAGHRREPGRASAGRSARHAPRERPPARP